jgi:hypothetical protein
MMPEEPSHALNNRLTRQDDSGHLVTSYDGNLCARSWVPEEPPKAPQLRISFGHAGDGGSQILSPEAAAQPKEVITPAVRPIVHRTEQAGTPAKLSQALRERIVVIVKEVIALNKMELGEGLTFNRVSGAVYSRLLAPENAGLSEDDAVNLAIHLTCKNSLGFLLTNYDSVVRRRADQARKQVYGIVNNMIGEDLPNREQILGDTLRMLETFPLVRSITGIRKLVKARIENGYADVDEDAYMYLS